jgi:Pvc16 N-terminal domain
MATADVIKDMGETLLFVLRAGIPSVDPTLITVATPDEFEALREPAKPNITVFLYRIAVNPTMRNDPRRLRPDGSIVRQPLPLELSFLITAWAKDTRDELLIIGRILQVLYEHSELGAADLIGASWDKNDTVQVVLESLPLEDHYRIWDANDVPYRLSLTYLARPPVVDAQLRMEVI